MSLPGWPGDDRAVVKIPRVAQLSDRARSFPLQNDQDQVLGIGQPWTDQRRTAVGKYPTAGSCRDNVVIDAMGDNRAMAESERASVSSGSPYEDRFGFSRALRIGRRVLVAGTAPISANGEVDPDPAAQTRLCLEIIASALETLGATLADVVRTRMYIVDRDDAEAVGAAHGEVFGEHRPVATMVIVSGLLDHRWRVEIEAEAVTAPE
jgi:enamine deaminase RidA (YjgF/YER057c/UK114 family)